jgi:TatD DNase family protein
MPDIVPTLFDTHAHLDEDAFTGDVADVVQRAVDAGVLRIVTIGTTADSSRRAVEIATQFPGIVFAAVGIQPNYASEAKPGDWDTIVALAAESCVVAIGETGLDRYWDFAPIDLQVDYFRRHLELSRTLGKPFVVHCRDAEADVVAELRRAAVGAVPLCRPGRDAGPLGAGTEPRPLQGVMHSFCGTTETARACLELGLHISFSGMLTYKKNDDLRQTAGEIPRDRLLVETDSPYLTPVPLRGKMKRNEPANVVHTVACLAELHGLPPDELAAVTTTNAERFFGLK